MFMSKAYLCTNLTETPNGYILCEPMFMSKEYFCTNLIETPEIRCSSRGVADVCHFYFGKCVKNSRIDRVKER